MLFEWCSLERAGVQSGMVGGGKAQYSYCPVRAREEFFLFFWGDFG